MALSDGHALLVYSHTHPEAVRAFDFNGNQVPLTDRERRVLLRVARTADARGTRIGVHHGSLADIAAMTTEQRQSYLGSIQKPITIYGGHAYYHQSNRRAYQNDYIEKQDLNHNGFSLAEAFPSTHAKETKIAAVDDKNGRMVAMHWEPGENRAARFDVAPSRDSVGNEVPFTAGWDLIRVREYALPAEANAGGAGARPIIDVVAIDRVPRLNFDYSARSKFIHEAFRQRLDQIGIGERRIFLGDQFIYLWLPTGFSRGGMRSGDYTGEEQCWVDFIATNEDMRDQRNGRWFRTGWRPLASSHHRLSMLNGLHDPTKLREAGKFSVGSDAFFFIEDGNLYSGVGFQAFDPSITSALRMGTISDDANIYATRWHVWAFTPGSHQITRYPLGWAGGSTDLRHVNAFPAGHLIHDIVGYRNHLLDFRDAPIGITTPQPEPGAPPVPRLVEPDMPVTDYFADQPLTFGWQFDRVFAEQWIRRREVTNRGEDDESAGAWEHWNGEQWVFAEVTTTDARRPRLGGVLPRYTFDANEFGERDKSYDVGWRFTEADTRKTSAWSTVNHINIVTFSDEVSAAAPTWRFDGELHGDRPIDLIVTIPSGETADEIWIERSTHSQRLVETTSWWSGARDWWLSHSPQPAKTQNGMTGEQTVTLNGDWQSANTTAYWRVSWRRTGVRSLWSRERSVTTLPEALPAPAALTVPLTGSLLTTREPLEFRGVFPVDERGDLIWLRRRAVGGTAWQWWTGRVWADGLPKLPRGVAHTSTLPDGFDSPSFAMWSGRRHRTIFNFELAAGWAEQGQRWAYSVAYRGVNGWGSEWSNETVVRGSAYVSPLAQQGVILARDWNLGIRYTATDLDGNLIQLPASHVSAFEAYGNTLPDLIYGDEGWWITLTGISARNLNTGVTRQVITTNNLFAIAADIARGHYYYFRAVSSGWRLFRRNLNGSGTFTIIAESTSAQVTAAGNAEAGGLRAHVNGGVRAPWLTIGENYAYLGPYAIALDGSNDHLLSNVVIPSDDIDITPAEAWNTGTGNFRLRGRNFDADGDQLYFTSINQHGPMPEENPAQWVLTGNEVDNYDTRVNFWALDARPGDLASSSALPEIFTSADTHNWSIRVVNGRVIALELEELPLQGGTLWVSSIGVDPRTDWRGSANVAWFNSLPNFHTINEMDVYLPPNWIATLGERSIDYLQPKPEIQRGPLHKNPEEPLPLIWINGLIGYTHITVAVRERGEDDWLYFDERGRHLVVETVLDKQPAGSVLGAVEQANGYLMPAGWGINGRHYEIRLRYKAAGGGWSPWSDIEDIRARIFFTNDIPSPALIQPTPGSNVDGSLPFEFVVRIPDGFQANYVLMRREPQDGGTIEYWQEEVPERQFLGSVEEGWRTDSGIAWERSGRHPTQEISIPLPAGFQALGTTYLYSFQMVTSRATDGRASPWSADFVVGSEAGATQRSIQFVASRPEAPTWVSRSGAFDGNVATRLDWVFHPRLAGQVQEQFRLLRRPADDPEAVEWWGGDDNDANAFGPIKTATTRSSSDFTLPAGWQDDGTVFHYSVQTRADGDTEWSPVSSDLVVVAGSATVTIVSPVDGQQVGQMPRVDWRTDDPQVAYQVGVWTADSVQSNLYYSGWVLGDAQNAVAQLPQTANGKTVNMYVRIRDSYDRTSAWAPARNLPVVYTPAIVPSVTVTAADSDDHVNIEVGNLGEAETWTLERWQHITAPASAVAQLDQAGITQEERRRVYVLVDNKVPTGSTVTISDYGVRTGVPYSYRATAIHLNERRSVSNWVSITRPA